MILSSFKLQNPITARKDKNVRSKNIRRLESGWRKKANPKTLPSRTKEFILENPLESAVIGAGTVLGARYLIKGIKASKVNSTVLGANNKVYNNKIISTLRNSKQALDDDIVKVKNIWNTINNGKPRLSKEQKSKKILERKEKISNQSKSGTIKDIQKQIKVLRSQYIDKTTAKGTTYKKNITPEQRKAIQNQIKTLIAKIKSASTQVKKVDSSYNLKSHLSFF